MYNGCFLPPAAEQVFRVYYIYVLLLVRINFSCVTQVYPILLWLFFLLSHFLWGPKQCYQHATGSSVQRCRRHCRRRSRSKESFPVITFAFYMWTHAAGWPFIKIENIDVSFFKMSKSKWSVVADLWVSCSTGGKKKDLE